MTVYYHVDDAPALRAAIAAETGGPTIDLAVAQAWLANEGQSLNNPTNPLNIAIAGGGSGTGLETGKIGPSFSYPDVATGLRATAHLIVHSPYYRAIVASFGKGARAQAIAIQNSPWAGGHYGYGGILRSLGVTPPASTPGPTPSPTPIPSPSGGGSPPTANNGRTWAATLSTATNYPTWGAFLDARLGKLGDISDRTKITLALSVLGIPDSAKPTAESVAQVVAKLDGASPPGANDGGPFNATLPDIAGGVAGAIVQSATGFIVYGSILGALILVGYVGLKRLAGE